MASREVLRHALGEYSGTFLLISHDRYFIDSLVNRTWYVEGGGVETFIGNYSEFLERKARESDNEQVFTEVRDDEPKKKNRKSP